MVPNYLSTVQAISSFAAPPNFRVFCLFASVNRKKNYHFKVQVHIREGHLKLHCRLTTEGKNCEYHPAHSLLFIIILGGYIFYFISQTCAL